MDIFIETAGKSLFAPGSAIILLFMIAVQVGFIAQYIARIDFKIKILLDRKNINSSEEHENSDFL